MPHQISCTSSLPRIWAIEALACSNHVDISFLLELLEKTPEICCGIGRNARELASLKLLESLLIQGAHVDPSSSQRIKLDPSDHCEDVLRRILSQTSQTYIESAGIEISKWDLEPFVEHKRSNLPTYALKKLKDAIYTGNHSVLESLKELSGLPEAPEKDGNSDGITPRVEVNDPKDNFLLPRDLVDDYLARVNRKRRATSESAAGKLCTTHINSVKKYKHDKISTESNNISADRHIGCMSIISVPQIEGKSHGCARKTQVGSMELNEPRKDDDNGCTSSEGFVRPDEILPPGDTELNKKSKEHGQDQNIEDAKGAKNGFSALKGTNEDGDNSKQYIQIVGEVGVFTKKPEESRQDQNFEKANGDKNGFSVLKRANGDGNNSELNIDNVDEVDELAHMSNDYDGNIDNRTDIARKENASFGPHCTHSQDYMRTTHCRDPNLLAGTSKIVSGEERCSIEKKTYVEVKGRNGPSGDGNNQCTSPKRLVMNGEVLPHEKQDPHCVYELLNEKFEKSIQHSKGENVENGCTGFNGLKPVNEDVNKFERNVPTVCEPEDDVDKSTGNDGYHGERINIDTKKKLFLSSQFTYSQDSLATTDWRAQLCMKCNSGGKLLSCASDSCPLVIHESCLATDASLDTRGKFYCPFCAYSGAISKYMEVKKKATFARKDFAAFICLGPQQKPKKHSQRSFRAELEICNAQGVTTSSQVSETSGSEKHADVRIKKGVLPPSEMDLPGESKCSQSSESSDAEDLSKEDNESSGASKYFIRVRKKERQNLDPAAPIGAEKTPADEQRRR